MITRMIRKALYTSAFIAVFIPVLGMAAVSDTTQSLPQPTRFSALAVPGSPPQEEMITRLMVKPRYRTGDQLNNALRAHDASGLSKISSVAMSVIRPMSGGAHVIRLSRPVTLSEARVIAARLMRDPSVELAEPDRLKRPLAVTPNDPSYSSQWNLFAPTPSDLGGADLPNAWSITTGSAAVTVAVVDTGYRPHADIVGAILPGYDFISDIPTANDGDGRDADAQDPGDWITGAENTNRNGLFYGCGALNRVNQLTPSSWHGTHVAGIIAATMNNGVGIAGIAPNIQILPVRVLGKCGGYDSDIIDGMRWAAGIAVAGAPANAHPAQVLNMSLGGPASSSPCSNAYQSAVNDITAAGKIIVAAAGNDGSNQYLGEPANCAGVVAVTAHVKTGDNANYSNIGPGTFISAPGGGCGGATSGCDSGVYSLFNTGTTVPASDSYTYYEGTSMATPHVSGVIALMLSANSTLTPDQIKSYLQSSARPYPPGTLCAQTGYAGKCGAGMLDAYQALIAANNPSSAPPVVALGYIPSVVVPGDTATLSGSATVGGGAAIASYAWTQLTGPATVTINNAGTANASFTAPATGGTYAFMLTATDNRTPAQTGTATAVIHINSPPVLTTPVQTQSQSVVAGQSLNFTVTASDPDGDTPIFNSVSLCPASPSTCSTPLSSYGATLSATGNFSWPNPTPGSYILTYYASDYYANSATGTVGINVTTSSGGSGGSGGGGGGGGGGGSLDAEMLAAMALLAAGLRLRRRYANSQK
jgi:serine protease